ncbi:transcriptional regulator, HxlR family [Prosthecobacter debontii]|uniref:Transcriptional regulator, HxlR family n=1 Tax=Prosthecobacter debontii TaxID=48467 RepID=A0A1T4YCF2_9BACT|nr:helix-turn-helix domain-containing protein [Prosthecobacter debontii]SKA99373.1 transcriptional regulator, HxlR family [Prosthecobacter debontii]
MPSRSSAASSSASSPRRSPCPVACSLDIFGDRWSLLIIRDLLLGRSRFKDFTASPEGIPTNILSDRLEKLQAHGILTHVPVPEGGKRLAYALTDKGQALRPILRAMREWGLQWEPGTEAKMVPQH